METLLITGGVINGALIFLQDYRDRQVSLTLLLLMFVTGCGFRFIHSEDSLSAGLSSILLNLLFIGVTLSATWAWFRLRGVIQFWETHFGAGDLVMLVALTPWFPVMGFMIFFTASAGLIVILSLALQSIFSNQQTATIPYAGWMGLLFAPGLWITTLPFISLP